MGILLIPCGAQSFRVGGGASVILSEMDNFMRVALFYRVYVF